MTEKETYSQELLREFVIAGHWSLERVKEILTEFPEILNAAYQWGENDYETAIQAAAQVGNESIAEYLLSQGAPLEICTAAMLGRADEIRGMLEKDPKLIAMRGAHGITLLAHAALSGDVTLARMLHERGAHEGPTYALGNAVMKGHVEMARWLIEQCNPDLTWKNYEEKSLLTLARESGNEAMVALLREHGAP